MSVFVRLCGRPRLTVGEQVFEPPADRRSALLYYLAHVGGWVPREDLLCLFWPDFAENRARANLRQLTFVVRNARFGRDLEVEKTRLRFMPMTDLRSFAAASGGGAPSVWPGPLLEGFRINGAPEFDSWLELERGAWEKRFRQQLLVEVAASHDPESACSSLEAWLAHSPLDEECLRLLLSLVATQAGRSSALARFDDFTARLQLEIGVAPERETLDLVENLRHHDLTHGSLGKLDDASPLARHTSRRASAGRQRQWQVAGTAFVGRESELRLLADLLAPRGAVVTLLAPGGMGKTRLALEAAERLGSRFPDGATVVPLVAVQAADDVASAVVDALGVRPPQERTASEAVEAALKGSRVLVVLDNVEQVPEVARVVERWREAAPGVSWLLTSRVRVGVRGESVLELGGLPYPSGGEDVKAAHSAIALLRDRARGASIELRLDRDGPALARVTRLTGGMPLALELAAGWLRVLPLDKIADELESGLDVLVAAGEGATPRHASLRAVFDATWSALPEAERAALTRLSVFRGGFTEAAAREVADVGRPMLLKLRNRSMIELNASGRFDWHPLLGSYLRERSPPETTGPAQERHARYFMELLAHCERIGQRDGEVEAIETLKAEHPNLEAAWDKAVELQWWDDLVAGGAMFGLSYEALGRGRRWAELLRYALARMPRDTVPWALLECHEASMAQFAGRYQQAFDRRAVAVEVLRDHADEDPFSLAWGLTLLAEPLWSLDRPDEARAALRESVDLLERAGQGDLLFIPMTKLLAFADNPAEHEHWYERLRKWRAEPTAKPDQAANLRLHAKYLAVVHGAHEEAVATIEAALDIERAQGWYQSAIGAILMTAAELRADAGHVETAIAYAEQYLESWDPGWASNQAGIGEPLALRAELGWLRGDEGADKLLESNTQARSTHRGLLILAHLNRCQGALGAARSCADEARARIERERVGLDRAAWKLRALVAGLEVSLASQELARAFSELRVALEHAVSWHLFPGLLDALAVSLELLPTELAAEVAGYLKRQSAVRFALRRRLGASTDAPPVPDDRDAAWAEACSIAGRVIAALEGVSAGVSDPDPLAHHTGPPN